MMKNVNKYQRQYFMPPVECNDWVKKTYVDKAPIWCSVDLRDGNQALIVPMSLEQKVEFFKLLVKIGFKEIEVGFPAASETEYNFLRTLIDQNLIPDDVTIQVLTQAREHIIKRTFEAVQGAPHAVIHVYNSTSVAQREQVFKKSKEEILKIAVDGAKLLKKLADETEGNFAFEYSPESFTGTEPEYALEVCNAVLDVWQPTADNKCIINLPSTVQNAMPHVYASQIEYMSKNMKYRENVLISLHPHNDRGCGISDAEMGLLAGADRIEGTLFGNGERTGNVDILTVAYNMFSQGIDPKLDFSQINEAIEIYESSTGMDVHPRHPYAGDLVYTAFSGSHQDAIKKGMAKMAEHPDRWEVPYLPIDPIDVGRNYDPIIRINSQSGKGGVAYILENNYGLILPKSMQQNFGAIVTEDSVELDKELQPEEIRDLFFDTYYVKEPLSVNYYTEEESGDDSVQIKCDLTYNGKSVVITGNGNGIIDAFCKSLMEEFDIHFNIVNYSEHSMSFGNQSKAITYIQIYDADQNSYFGIGTSSNIAKSSLRAIASAVNKMMTK